MSQFNFERFRFQRASTCKVNSESEKENKPAQMRSTKSHSAKSYARGVLFEDVDDDDEEPVRKVSFLRKSRDPVVKTSTNVTNDENSQKESKLSEMFPQLSREKISEIVGSTSTLDGAVATCLLIPDDEADKDYVKTRRQDVSDSSLESGESQPYKRRNHSGVVGSPSTHHGSVGCVVISEDDDTNYVSKRKQNDSDTSLQSGETQPYKRNKQSEMSEDEVEYVDDNQDDSDEPSWEKREVMVKKLQRKFPNQDKEELRSVLEEHEWDVDEALHALLCFASPDDTQHSLEKSNHAKSKEKEVKRLGSCEKKMDDKESHSLHSSATDDSSNATVDSDDFSDEKPIKHSNFTLSSWVTKDLIPSVKKTTPCQKPTSSSKSAIQMVSRFASGTSLAKAQAEERKRKARAAKEQLSSDDYEDDSDKDTESSDSDNYSDAFASKGSINEEILKFFQEATLDELALISGCSVKKANKIIELRPFKDWLNLTRRIQKANGLSEDLLLGCKTVLKERTIIRELMSKCETISTKMVKQVTKVMRAGSETLQQTSLLNRQLQLKSYQVIGLKWLLLLHEHKLSGILADEMGLGKTIQTIAFLAHLLQNGIVGPHLITVPASTFDNWARELEMWCPSLKVLPYYGSVEDRHYLKHNILNKDVEFNVILTTYSFVIGNKSDRSLFRKLRLTYAIFDEGHMLKNMNTLRYRNLMSINAKHRLLLTGTPLQNNLLELMSLLNFIMPTMFSSSTTQLYRMFSMKAQEEQSHFEKKRISQARRIMKPFILRRLKNEVLKQLPDKEEMLEFCSMSEKQQVLYQTLLKKMKASTTGEKQELCNVMMQLRKMANHPLLHRQYYTTEKLSAMSKLMLKEPTHHDANAALIQEDMEVMSDFELHNLCQQYTSISSYQLDNNLLLDSGKFHWLTQKLASLKEKGDRVVLFSQFVVMLDIIEILMKHLNHRYIRMDGSTPIANRIVLIDEFNTDDDIFVFLLSTRAGGLGINLTSANVVILHDIDWNPYNDKQAEDRCHRLGQTRTVHVIKLISKDSIEEGILKLSQKKLKLEHDMTTAEQSDEGTLPEDMASLLKASLGL
ncbi:SWI/SNF-related matrix-associated actin-dependent regulator of chromatin subfamily A containing DEAD/H box 1A isoform X1 [Syngnathus typhle]|uniref:SWI/SNF-related matrix-associated actin-dependent regulator of chromatin subfamily A containing DEAD/H box 1A isoform X1 n=1 Tax=Syngnathus typhle TaxID=161592 RepID=UPI002A6A2BA5|nr:SWI/SNF-related matrix-associated actin-dependent regulator of chromatin subfamily A containing DEAD/H box 1A isoform X1 [Syngnathus typhle]